QNSDGTTQQAFEGLDPLACDLVVRFLGPQRFPLWVQRRRAAREGLQIGEPALRVRGRRSDDAERALWQPPRERRDQHRRARPEQPPHAEAGAGRRQPLRQGAHGRQVVKPIEQEIEWHQRVSVATPSSVAASSNASASRIALASERRVPAKRSAAKRSSSSNCAVGPRAAATRSGAAGVRSDSRGSRPNTVAPTVSAPRTRNSTRGVPSATSTAAAPATTRFTRASTKGTNPGAAGSAVQAVSSRLPSSTTSPARTNHGSPFTVARTSPPVPSKRYRRVTC